MASSSMSSRPTVMKLKSTTLATGTPSPLSALRAPTVLLLMPAALMEPSPVSVTLGETALAALFCMFFHRSFSLSSRDNSATVACVEKSCAIYNSVSDLPAVPFRVSIVDGKCVIPQ